MKILIDARFYGQENAGLGRYTASLIEELARGDYSADFVVFLRKKHFNELKLPKNWRKVCVDIRHYSFQEQIILPFLIAREKPDLVHFLHFNVPLFYFRPYVVTIHDLLMHQFKGMTTTTLNPVSYFFKRLGYKVVFKRAINAAKIIFVPSLTVAKELASSFGESKPKIRVIYEGVNKIFWSMPKLKINLLKKYKIDDKYLLYCGNAYPHKNLDFLLTALKAYSQEKSKEKIILVMVLPRDVFSLKLKKRAEELELNDRVRILENISDPELSFLMHFSLAYIAPSLSEGFGLPGLEALSAGTLLMAADIPVFKEIYGDSALYFEPAKTDSLVNLLERVVKFSSYQREIWIKKGRDRAKNYSFEKMAGSVYQGYREALKK